MNPREVNTLIHAMDEILKELQSDEDISPKVKHAFTGVGQLLEYVSNCLVWEATSHPSVSPSGPGHHQVESEKAQHKTEHAKD